jgi:hypothetical protein
MTANRSSSAHTTQVKTGKRCDQDQNNTLFTLFGTLLVASGTATLNQYIERDFDAQMRRAQAPRGRPSKVACSPCPRDRVIGRGHRLLAVTSGVLASLLALLTLLSYLFKYTPLKRITPGCVLIGAFPGAVPPLIGWAGRIREVECRSVGTLRNPVSVAVPPLYGDRVALPRRLRPRGLFGVAQREPEDSCDDSSKPVAAHGSYPT